MSWGTPLSALRAPQGAQPLTAGKSQIAPVPPEVLLIEEDTLPQDPSLQSSSRPTLDTTAAGRSAAALSQDGSAKDNGLKLYRFTLAPGESLTTKVQCEPADEVTQRLGLLSGPSFTPSTDSKSQIARVNRLRRQQRTNGIEFKNTEDRPFPLLLIVYGSTGHPYKIHITRVPRK